MKHTFEYDLTSILVNKNSISEKEALAMQDAFAESDSDQFENFLIEEGLVSEVELLDALSRYYKIASFDVNGYFFDTFLLRKFPKGFLLRHGIIPLEADNESIMFIASNPADQNLVVEIARFVSYDVYFCVGIRRDICDAVKEFYDKSDTDMSLEGDIIFEESEGLDLGEFEFYED